MKKFFAVLFACLAALTVMTCCAPCVKPAPARPPGVTEVHNKQEFALTIHVDSDFNDKGRAAIREAGNKWRRASAGRILFEFVFDLDRRDRANVAVQIVSEHALMIGVSEDEENAVELDSQHPDTRPIAGSGKLASGAAYVVLVMDRIPADHFVEVTTHELGHLAGMPDLKILGAVMSGADTAFVPVPSELTPADIELCRFHRLCD